MTEAVFFDALGTLVELEPPWVELRKVVPAEIGDERLAEGVRAEMGYYREHAHEGRDEASLADLRARCAALLSDRLGHEVSVEELLGAVRFSAFADSAPALEALRERGLRLVVVSNWDCSLEQVLEDCGLLALLDGAVSSAAAGARKPDPALFAPALEIAAVEAADALHVGDTAAEDVVAAEAAGIRALLIDRGGGADLASLAEVADHL